VRGRYRLAPFEEKLSREQRPQRTPAAAPRPIPLAPPPPLLLLLLPSAALSVLLA